MLASFGGRPSVPMQEPRKEGPPNKGTANHGRLVPPRTLLLHAGQQRPATETRLEQRQDTDTDLFPAAEPRRVSCTLYPRATLLRPVETRQIANPTPSSPSVRQSLDARSRRPRRCGPLRLYPKVTRLFPRSRPRPRPRPLNPRVPSAVRPLLLGVPTIPAVDGPKMALADEQPEGPAGQTTVAEANG